MIIILVSLALKENFDKLYLVAFITGLISDLFMGGFLGFSSLFNLFFVFLISLFKTRFAYNWRWAILFIVIFQLIWEYAWRFYF